MKKIILGIFVFVLLLINTNPVNASIVDDLLTQIKNLKTEISLLKGTQTGNVLGVVADTTPRIMYWDGWVNQHVDSKGVWQTDPDGVSGPSIDKLTYCKKWYSQTVSVENYQNESIDNWRSLNSRVVGIGTNMSTKCVQPGADTTKVDGGWTNWVTMGSCFNGSQTQTRSCTNPAPANGGSQCVGSTSQTISCEEHIIGYPVVSTTTATNIATGSFRSGGNITSDGGSPITSRGVCYGTSSTPTSCSQAGAGIGSFPLDISMLAANTKYYYRAFATNANGTRYGDTYSFTTLASTYTYPVVSTTTATNIATGSFRSGGNITSDGGSPITSRGVCYGTSSTPTSCSQAGAGIGSFPLDISMLAANTKYYYRAFATNANGTRYGDTYSFTTLASTYTYPVVSTTTATNIATGSFRSGGNITSDGGSPITSRGVCYGTSSTPTSCSQAGAGIGSFPLDISMLAANTKYYYRAFATNANGTRYGDTYSFTTLASTYTYPVVSTTTATNIATGSFRSGGNITSDGGSPITSRGVCYGTSSTPTSCSQAGAGIGSFPLDISMLAANTKYYYRAFATNANGTRYGDTYSFTTLASTYTYPVVSTTTATNIATGSFRSGGNITSDGGSPITSRGVCYGTSSTPTSCSQAGAGIGSFPLDISMLAANTKYYYRAFATNANGTRYGDTYSFTTLAQGTPSITVISPNGGENLSFGKDYTATWKVGNSNSDKVNIALAVPNIDGNGYYFCALGSSLASTGRYTFKLTENMPCDNSAYSNRIVSVGKYKIYLYYPAEGMGTFADESDDVFTMTSSIATYVNDYVCGAPLTEKLESNMSGGQVNALQKILNGLGYLSGNSMDGKFGLATYNAVRAYQTAKGLIVDGIVGAGSRASLNAKWAEKCVGNTVVANNDNVNDSISSEQKTNDVLNTNVSSVKANDCKTSISAQRLQFGSTGIEVTKLQLILNYLGYLNPYTTNLDGQKFGPQTELAVRDFQLKNSLQSDGIVGPNTINTLHQLWKVECSGPATNTGSDALTDVTPQNVSASKANDCKTNISAQRLQFGSIGSEVTKLQTILNYLGYLNPYTTNLDGHKFGPETESAVKVFQAQNKLQVDGIVGPNTINSLNTKWLVECSGPEKTNTGSDSAVNDTPEDISSNNPDEVNSFGEASR
jgi:peptidoglycan hydrolase-like protein with peptidoglycan-binding domain/FlaG/FlaF family flagellin (archaellin)